MHLRAWSVSFVGLSVAIAGSVSAHPDDPKLQDREPRYEGNGWREADGWRDPPPEFPTFGITLRSWLTLGQLDNASDGNDCWGYVSPSGREYAIMGTSSGTVFVEVTNPAAATVIGDIPGPNSPWRDIKVYRNYAYAVSEGGAGIQVINLADIDNGNVSLVRTVLDGGTDTTHNVAIDTTSGFLYRTGGGSNGLRIYDLFNASNPAYVTTWADRYVHDAQVITMESGPFAGSQIAFSCSGFNGGQTETGFEVLDVTNKGAITQLARVAYSGTAYSHQVWLSPDRRYAYLNDELDEQTSGTPQTTRILDISDLRNPVEVGTFSSGSTSVDHNLYMRDTLIFEANYRSGLSVFDATDPLHPQLVASYDTYPTSDSANFNGLWSNYPYLPSGTIIGSDIERGLFVWTLDAQPISIYFPDGQPTRIGTQGTVIRIEMIENTPGTLDPTTPTLWYDLGAGFVAEPMTNTHDNVYEASLPAVGCIQSVRYYVTAGTLDGGTTRSPIPAQDSYAALIYDDATTVGTFSFELGAEGWTVNAAGTDTASTGAWTHGNPNGTIAQPENDHTAGGSNCWFTGQGAVGGGLGDNDIDGGETSLTSPLIDLSGLAEPAIRMYRWYSNATGATPGTDTGYIEISNNGGGSWTTLEQIGPGGAGTNGGWASREFIVSDFVVPTSQVRVRFRASDLGSGSIVEAALDDVEIVDLSCAVIDDCPGDVNGDNSVDLDDLLFMLGAFGQTGQDLPGDFDDDGEIDLDDLLTLLSNFGAAC